MFPVLFPGAIPLEFNLPRENSTRGLKTKSEKQMSDINLTVVRHKGEVAALGRNVAVKLMLEKSGVRPRDPRSVWNVAREVWRKPSSSPTAN